ncbi:MAG: addiction module antidote protein, partial [Spongiibacteraceae bacterium]
MKKLELSEFDASEYLDSDEARAEYLRLALDSGDNAEFLRALGDVAKAVGMSKIAEGSGLTRASLYKSVSENANPHFSTVSKI